MSVVKNVVWSMMLWGDVHRDTCGEMRSRLMRFSDNYAAELHPQTHSASVGILIHLIDAGIWDI
jgi:hypothetical protein